MTAHSEQVNVGINTSQKRPLSIIAEQDGDDHDVINIAKYLQTGDVLLKDNKFAIKDIILPRKEIKREMANHKLPESKKLTHNKNEENKHSSRECNSKLKNKSSPVFISKSELTEDGQHVPQPSSCTNKKTTDCVSSSALNNKDSNYINEISSTEKKENRTHKYNSLEHSVKMSSILPKTIEINELIFPQKSRKLNSCFQSSSENLENNNNVAHETNQNSSNSTTQSFFIPGFSNSRYHTELETSRFTNTLDIKDQNIHNPEITITLVDETHDANLQTSCISNINDIENKINIISTDDISSNVLNNKSYNVNTSNNTLTKRTLPNFNLKRAKLSALSFNNSKKVDPSDRMYLPAACDTNIDTDLEIKEKASHTTQILDFRKLQETTEKLHLSTRRPSTMLWRQQYLEGQGLPGLRPGLNGDVKDERLTEERKQRIDDALEWLRTELQEMRSQDQNLARLLLTIRQDIHQLKLKRSTEEHQELIEDFQSELDDLQETADVLDFPQTIYSNNPLKHIGVTRLNMNARRFSAC